MSNKESRVINPKIRAHFSKIIRCWLGIIEKYSDEYTDDALYYYNERATLSTLAGAVWRSGEYALEEFGSFKIKKRKRILGRADLWFSFGQKEYLIEAKQIWPSISRWSSDLNKQLDNGLNNAVNDVRKLKKYSYGDSVELVGILFVTPYLPPSDQGKANVTKGNSKLINAIKNTPSDFYGFVFPSATSARDKYGYLYPGVAILGKMIK